MFRMHAAAAKPSAVSLALARDRLGVPRSGYSALPALFASLSATVRRV
jgi:hypothetical protein